jgi:hypothetical protein
MSGTPLQPGSYTFDLTHFHGDSKQSGFDVNALFHIVSDATLSCKIKLVEIATRRSSISIGDMFEMQMLMNHLSQLSEMSTALVGAANSAIISMTRNLKT